MTKNRQHRPTFAQIDLNALADNFTSVKAFIGDSVKYLAVVKANAYGHGAVECSRVLAGLGVDWLGVAIVEEAIELRNAGITLPILILGSFWPGQEPELLEHDLTPVIFRLDQATLLEHAASKLSVTHPYHLKIDTGMGRLGVRPEDVEIFARKLAQFTHIRLAGVMTHFAAADDLEQGDFTDHQKTSLYTALEVLRRHGHSPDLVDLANSPASIAYPETRGNMVRLGGVLYGLGGDVLPKGIPTPELKPVTSLFSEISHLKSVDPGDTIGYGRSFTAERKSLIASIPIGYADGYSRRLSNVGAVIVNDRYAPIIGKISMDWTIIDVTDIPGVEIGSKVVLIGKSDNCAILAEDLAGIVNTISYEITCGIGSRVERRYKDVLGDQLDLIRRD